jgi:hypothetical protein
VVNPALWIFAVEDNLAYRDYVVLHQGCGQLLWNAVIARPRRVLTAWPANDELTRPYLGYVTRPDGGLAR